MESLQVAQMPKQVFGEGGRRKAGMGAFLLEDVQG
jgi:hypothetical protein